MGALGWSAAAAGLAAAIIVLIPEWTSFPPEATQVGPNGQSMIHFVSGQKSEPVPQLPPPAPAPDPALLQLVAAGYQNVQVLADLPPAEFMHLQQAITQWVSPTQGCAFCHTEGDWAADAKPQKRAARLMLQMTRAINANWTNHVAPAGVTCFTCHRGQPVPAETWFPQPGKPDRPMVARTQLYSEAADTVRKFFPDASWSEYLVQDEPIQALSPTALPTGQVHAAVEVKRIYEMMMQLSEGMGVNCTYCHNSRAFSDWSQSTPQRWTAHYAFEQTRGINNEYLLKLAELIPMTRQIVHETRLPVLPAAERGVQPGNGLVVCATCHYAQPKPMGGAAVIADWKSLSGPAPQTTEQRAETTP